MIGISICPMHLFSCCKRIKSLHGLQHNHRKSFILLRINFLDREFLQRTHQHLHLPAPVGRQLAQADRLQRFIESHFEEHLGRLCLPLALLLILLVFHFHFLIFCFIRLFEHRLKTKTKLIRRVLLLGSKKEYFNQLY